MTGVAPRLRLPPDVRSPDEPIPSRARLVELLAAGGKDPHSRLVGIESERVPVRDDGTAAPYDDGTPGSVRAFLEALVRTGAWEPVVLEGQLLSLDGDLGAVYLEPGAQPELALPPVRTATEVSDLLEAWCQQIRAAAASTGVHALSLGLQPVTPIRDIPWIPRERYEIMSRHLGARGRLAHHMMKGSAGVQVNVDYTSEDDAATLVRTALLLSPLLNAIVANSPLEEGRPNGFLTMRPQIWLETDPERCGVLPWVLDEGFSFARYVDWALGVTAMFVIRDGHWHAVGDRTFGILLERGHETHGPATWADFALHLTTLFPEVRVKQHVEIRGADSCPHEMVTALAAAWRGVLYDEESRARAADLLPGTTGAELARLHEEVGRRGLAAETARGPVREVAGAFLDIAANGLERLAAGSAGPSEAALLDPLRQVVADGRTPAERLLARWREKGPAALVRSC